MAVRTRKLNAYQQQMLNRQQGEWAASNAYALSQANQSKEATTWERDYNTQNLTRSTWANNVARGTARGNVATGQINTGLVPINRNYSQGMQNYQNMLKQLEMQKQNQANQLYGMTHFNYSKPKVKKYIDNAGHVWNSYEEYRDMLAANPPDFRRTPDPAISR